MASPTTFAPGGLLSYLNPTTQIGGNAVQTSTPMARTTPTYRNMVGSEITAPIPQPGTGGMTLGAVAPANPNSAAINKLHSQSLDALTGGGTGNYSINNSGFSDASNQALLNAEKLANPGSSFNNSAPLPVTSPTPTPTTPTSLPTPAPTPGTLGTGSPSAIASTTATGGDQAYLNTLGNAVATGQGLLQSTQKVTDPYIQQNLDTIAKATAEEEALTGGSYSGTAADYSGRLAQLENLKQSAQGNVNTAQGNLAQFGNLAQGGLLSAATGLNPSNRFAQVGQGTTVLNASGQPVATTPVIGPVGSQTAYGVPATTYGEQGTPTTYNAPGAQGSAGNTPYTAGVVAGQANIGANVVAMQSAHQQAQSIGNMISASIQQNPSFNSDPLTFVNAIKQWVAGQTSDPAYTNTLNDLQEYANTIAPVLGAGGNSTDLKTTIANSLIPTLQSGGTIQSALSNLDNLAQGKINAAISSGQNAQGAAASGGNTTQAGGYNFTRNADGSYTYSG